MRNDVSLINTYSRLSFFQSRLEVVSIFASDCTSYSGLMHILYHCSVLTQLSLNLVHNTYATFCCDFDCRLNGGERWDAICIHYLIVACKVYD